MNDLIHVYDVQVDEIAQAASRVGGDFFVFNDDQSKWSRLTSADRCCEIAAELSRDLGCYALYARKPGDYAWSYDLFTNGKLVFAFACDWGRRGGSPCSTQLDMPALENMLKAVELDGGGSKYRKLCLAELTELLTQPQRSGRVVDEPVDEVFAQVFRLSSEENISHDALRRIYERHDGAFERLFPRVRHIHTSL